MSRLARKASSTRTCFDAVGNRATLRSTTYRHSHSVPHRAMQLRRFCLAAEQASRHHMLACHLYISEGRNRELLSDLEVVARGVDGAALIKVFIDEPYNRSNFTFASRSVQDLCKAVTTTARAALARLDLRQHSATHPRLGAVDHISCHPLSADAKLSQAAEAARCIGAALGSSANELAVPVYFYGHANPHGRALADIRRGLGYFKPDRPGQWAGPMPQQQQQQQQLAPDFGPPVASAAAGIAAVGAVPWIVNYNIPIGTTDLETGAVVARAVSERGGGLPAVQAMALRHGEGTVEVACNLLAPDASGPQSVQQLVEQLCTARHLKAGRGYVVGGSREEVLREACSRLDV